MGDRRLVVVLVVIRFVFVVVARIAREQRLVVDLERARVGVIVVRRHPASDLHQGRRLRTVPIIVPNGMGNDLSEPAAVVLDQGHIGMALLRRRHAV